MIVTHHALERWLEHHPQDEVSDILVALETSEEVSSELVRAITQRMVVQQGSTYFVPPTKMGILVVFEKRVVTYLRLSQMQRDILFPVQPLVEPLIPESPEEVPPFMGNLRIEDVVFTPDTFFQNSEVMRTKFMSASWEKVPDLSKVWKAKVGKATWYAHTNPNHITVFNESGHVRRLEKLERNRLRSLNKVKMRYQAMADKKYGDWLVNKAETEESK